MDLQPFDRLLLIGHGSPYEAGNDQYRQLAQALAGHLAVAVQPCFLELAEPSIEAGIELCVAAGARRVAVLPLFLGPAGHQKNDVPAILNHARLHYPEVEFRYGTPIGTQYHLVQVLAERASAAIQPSQRDVAAGETALLVVGRGSRDPDSNAEVCKLARLLYEGRDYGMVEVAFQSVIAPDVTQGIVRCVRLGARRVVVLPYLLFSGFVQEDIAQRTQEAQAAYPDVEMLVGTPLFPHAGLLAAVAQRYEDLVAGTATMTCDLCKYRQRMAGFEHEHGLPQASHHHE